jgi:hypothetical protein
MRKVGFEAEFLAGVFILVEGLDVKPVPSSC